MKRPVLIVDDEQDLLEILEMMVQDLGFDTILASNGKIAMNLLESCLKPILILSDFKMPEMDGLELCKYVRTREDEIPFVLVSGFINQQMIEEGKIIGVTRTIDKPFRVEQVSEIVAKELKIYEEKQNELKRKLA